MRTVTLSMLLAVTFVAQRAQAEVIYAVTAFRELIQFDSATPGNVVSTLGITGLTGQGQFESVAAIDFRPATGQLYALGNAPGSIYRLYTVDTATAVATQVGADINTISGTFLGFDFNPTVDRIRIVTDADQNYRFHPTTGALVLQDTSLAFAALDPNANANPNVVGAAYTNNFAGAGSTLLYDIDSSLDILTTQVPPNNGTLNTVGSLGVDFSDTVGFDISGDTGIAYASSASGTVAPVSNFYTVNLATGAASLIGPIGTTLIINDIAAPSAVPEPSSLGLVSLAVLCVAKRRRNRR